MSDSHGAAEQPDAARSPPAKHQPKRGGVFKLFGRSAGRDDGIPPEASPRGSVATAPEATAVLSQATAPSNHRDELLALLESAAAVVRGRSAMSEEDVERVMDDVGDSFFDLRGRIVDSRAAAEAATSAHGDAQDGPPAPNADPSLEKAFAATKAALGAVSENKAGVVVVLDMLSKQVDPGVSLPNIDELSDMLGAAGSLVEFVQLLNRPRDPSAKGIKAVTRFLATNGLEIASTIVNVAKVAADFVPVPGLGIAIGIIDKILKNIGDSRDAPKIMQAFCANLGEIKAIIAPMANQWFSADVRRKCSDLVTLLKEADAAVEKSKADAKTWRALMGGASTKMAAQVEALRKKLGKIKELLSLAMQVDSAMMLMRMAEQLNIIDVKADKMLALLRPRTLLLRHDDFMVVPKPLDSSGSFRVFEAKMDGSPFVIKEFRGGIEGREDDLEAEARRWFNANHPSLLQLTGICLAKDRQTGRGPFIAMPFVEHDLESFLTENPDLGMDEKLSIVQRIARGLKYLHEQAPNAPIVHGSVTMRHVRVESRGQVVGDLYVRKISKVVLLPSIGTASKATTDLDSAAFVPPEASKPGFKLTARLDVFAFGILAQSLVLGRHPRDVRDKETPCPPGLSPELWELLCLATSKVAPNRPPLDKIVSQLNALLCGEHKTARPGASDVELLCSAFPDWANESGITAGSIDPTGALVFVYDGQTERSVAKWRLEWDTDHCLTSLRMTGCGIAGSIPQDIGRLTQLKTLWLDQNELEGEIPPEIFRLRNLTSLNVQGNGLVEIPKGLTGLANLKILLETVPATITLLKNLRILDLSWQSLKELPDDIGKLQSLSTLILSRNRISKLPESIGEIVLLEKLLVVDNALHTLPESVCELAYLMELDLQANQIGVLPENFGKLVRLRKLNLNFNQLTQLPDGIGGLKQLTELKLDGNQLSHLPESVGQLKMLRLISLEENKLESLPETIGRLDQLTELRLSLNQLKTCPEAIGGLRMLRTLTLVGNQITGLPESLGQLTALTSLNVQQNQLTTAPESIGGLVNLKWLDLSQNAIIAIPESIQSLASLVELTLNSNQLERLPDGIGKLKQLGWITLAGNRLVELPESISDLESLKELDLTGNLLTGLPERIGCLINLIRLDLTENRISSLPNSIGGLSNLQKL
ncbi:hypothetical protein HK105_207669 [Polyrhizophydium stewartii]|uniref:Protein kinase domain-containing protein n=1 Tax=Polyrhizophydium stewartii TaxID=2732419 RepID=A0ABR4N086_9FUNG